VAASVALFGLGPLMLGAVVIAYMASHDQLAVDFRLAFLPAAHAIMNGVSPYPSPVEQLFATGQAYVYPPFAALVLVPFTAIPVTLAAALITTAMIVTVPAILAVVGVRDWRCYGAALLWAPVAAAVQTANLTLALALLAALLWRYRDSARAALPGGISLASKIFLWPLTVWLVATGRGKQALATLGVAVVLVVLSWAAIGFADIGNYATLVHRLSDYQDDQALTAYALGLELGLPDPAAKLLWLLLGVVSLGGCFAYGRRGDDRASFTAGIGAALLLSPIIWLHYLVLLLVPLALSRPCFGPLWLMPVLLWLVPASAGERGAWQTALTVGVTLLLLVACVWQPRRHSREAAVYETRRRTAILSSR
jgi:hypothetical protein